MKDNDTAEKKNASRSSEYPAAITETSDTPESFARFMKNNVIIQETNYWVKSNIYLNKPNKCESDDS